MSRRLQVLVPESLHAKIRKAAQRSGLSRNEWVRRAIARALEQPRGRNPLDALAKLGGPTADIDDMLSEVSNGRR